MKNPTLTADTPMAEVVEIHKIFNSSKGKVAFQLPSDATQFGWQHTSRFYKTEQILRDGPISELHVEADPSIPGVTFKNAKGETETVRYHLEHFPVDALIVVKGGKVAFEHYSDDGAPIAASNGMIVDPVILDAENQMCLSIGRIVL